MGDRSVVWSGVLVGHVVDDGGSSVQCLGVRVGLCGAGVGIWASLSPGRRGHVHLFTGHWGWLVVAWVWALSRVQLGGMS
jgi:hypothetical protein